MKNKLRLLIFTFAGFWLLFFLLQKTEVYTATLGKITDNYRRTGDSIFMEDTAYKALTESNLVRWDATHYNVIRQYSYSQSVSGDYIFAFFPLFPFIWKISHLSPLGIIFLNFLLFSFGLLVILSLFKKPDNNTNLLIYLSFPSLIIFLIPYTEALYWFLLAVAFYAFSKNKTFVLMVSLFLVAMTRPSFTILFLAIVSAEVYYLPYFIRMGGGKIAFKRLIFSALALIAGTSLVSIIQFFNGSKSIFKFIEVQKHWGNYFQIPVNLLDWSHEGFGINVGVLIFIFIPLLILMVWEFIVRIKSVKSDQLNRMEYLSLISIFYILGSTIFILFFRGGSLNCLFRFTLSTPFTFFLINYYSDKISSINLWIKLLAFLLLLSLGFYTLMFTEYSQTWHFFNNGFFLLASAIFLWLIQQWKSSILYQFILWILLFANLIWTTYLFNTYLANAWLFA